MVGLGWAGSLMRFLASFWAEGLCFFFFFLVIFVAIIITIVVDDHVA